MCSTQCGLPLLESFYIAQQRLTLWWTQTATAWCCICSRVSGLSRALSTGSEDSFFLSYPAHCDNWQTGGQDACQEDKWPVHAALSDPALESATHVIRKEIGSLWETPQTCKLGHVGHWHMWQRWQIQQKRLNVAFKDCVRQVFTVCRKRPSPRADLHWSLCFCSLADLCHCPTQLMLSWSEILP